MICGDSIALQQEISVNFTKANYVKKKKGKLKKNEIYK